MKRVFTLSAAVGLVLCVAQNASAANLPMPAMAPAAPPPIQWTGFYLGGVINLMWSDPQTFTAADPLAAFGVGGAGVSIVPNVSMSGSDVGWALGPVLGYNWQLGNFVLGAEGDISWGNLSVDARTGSPLPCIGCGGAFFVNNAYANAHEEVNSLSSVRGRLGWIWTVHNYARGTAPPGSALANPFTMESFQLAGDYLFYGTGGIGWGWTHNDFNYNCPGIGAAPFCTVNAQAPVSVSKLQSGAVWGGGLEFAPEVNRGKLHWGIEYLHYDLKDTSANGTTISLANGAPVVFGNGTCVVGTPCVHYTSSNLTVNDIRVRLTYRWD